MIAAKTADYNVNTNKYEASSNWTFFQEANITSFDILGDDINIYCLSKGQNESTSVIVMRSSIRKLMPSELLMFSPEYQEHFLSKNGDVKEVLPIRDSYETEKDTMEAYKEAIKNNEPFNQQKN